MGRGGEGVPWPVMAFILTAARLIAPSSELAIEERFYPKTALEDICGVAEEQVNKDRLYRALGMDAEKLDPSTPLSSFGFDSLMAVQLKTRIEAELGVTLAMIQFLKGPSVDELVPSLVAAVAALAVAGGAPSKHPESWEEGSL